MQIQLKDSIRSICFIAAFLISGMTHAQSITTASVLPTVAQMGNFSQTLLHTGFSGSPIWYMTEGTELPAGLTLDSLAGVLSGKPTGFGTFYFTIGARSGASNTTKSFSMVIAKNEAFNRWELIQSDTNTLYSWMGINMDISEKYAVKTYPIATVDTLQSGLVQVYEKSGNTWVLDTILLANDRKPSDNFGNDVALTDNTLFVSAQYDDLYGDDNVGSVYIFEKSGGAWRQTQKLFNPDSTATAFFGYSVSASGDYAVVGSVFGVSPLGMTGTAYVYHKVAGIWTFQAKLSPSAANIFSQFGVDVNIEGNTIVIGAPNVNIDPTNIYAGKCFVYTRTGTTWTEQSFPIPTDRAALDLHSFEVSISGDWIFASSPFKDVGTRYDIGKVYSFRRTGTTWSYFGSMVDSSLSNGALLGYGHDVYGSMFAVGSRTDIGSDIWAGKLNYYELGSTTWNYDTSLTAPTIYESGFYSESIKIHGDWMMVNERGRNSLTGALYFYRLKSTPVITILSIPSASEFVPYTVTLQDSGFADNPSWSLVEGSALPAGLYLNSSTGVISGTPTGAGRFYFTIQAEYDGDRDTQWYALDIARDTSYRLWLEIDSLLAPDATTGSRFGNSTSISDKYAVVGSWQKTVGSNAYQGAVYIFYKSDSGWVYQTTLTAADGTAFQYYGSEVSLNGEYLAVSSLEVGNSGSVYVYKRSGSTWTLQNKLRDSVIRPNARFGSGVSLHGNYLAIGSQSDSGAVSVSGTVSIFKRTDTAWLLQSEIYAPDGLAGDFFGYQTSLYHDHLLVSAFQDDIGANTNQGSVYVFVRSGETWSLQQKITAFDSASYQLFGSDVSLSGNSALIGANKDGAGDVGAAYIYTRSGTSWTLQTKIVQPGTQDLGTSVSLDGDFALISESPNARKRVNMYVRTGSTWAYQDSLVNPTDSIRDGFAYSTSLSGNHAIVSLIDKASGGVALSGMVRIFTLSQGTNDAGLANLVTPVSGGCEGISPIVVNAYNAGNNTIHSLVVNCTANGTVLSPASFTGLNLLPGDSIALTLGSYNFSSFLRNSVTASISLVNGIADTITTNNNLTASNITLNRVVSTLHVVTICENPHGGIFTPIFLPIRTYDTLTSYLGCDSIYITETRRNYKSQVNQNITICAGDSVHVGTSVYGEGGTYYDTLTNVSGCDSFITTHITLLPVSYVSQNINICNGYSFTLGLHVYFTNGTYTDTFTGSNGCDSILTTVLQVHDPVLTSQAFTLCPGVPVYVGSSVYTGAGIFYDTLFSAYGCDSIVTTSIHRSGSYTVSQTVSICSGQVYRIGSSAYSTAGTYRDTLASIYGCDSIVITRIVMLSNSSTTQLRQICPGDSITISGVVYNRPGTYRDTLLNYLGCDSIFTLRIAYYAVSNTFQTFIICSSDSIVVGSSVYRSSGTFTDTFSSYLGCDSVVTTRIGILSSSPVSETISICLGDTAWYGGVPYTSSFRMIDTLTSSLGCDSIFEFSVDVLYPVVIFQALSYCPGGFAQVGNSFYFSPGIYSDTFIAYSGCDSVVISRISEYPLSTGTQTFNLFLGDSVMVNSHVYRFAGVYTDTLVSSQGCDSVLTTVLNIIPSGGVPPEGDNHCFPVTAFLAMDYANWMLGTQNASTNPNCDTLYSSNISASTQVGESMGTCTGGTLPNGTVWYLFDAPSCAATQMRISTNNDSTNFNTRLTVFQRNVTMDCLSGYTEITCNDDGGAGTPTQASEIIMFPGTGSVNYVPGERYMLQVSGYNNSRGNYGLVIDVDAPDITTNLTPANTLQVLWPNRTSLSGSGYQGVYVRWRPSSSTSGYTQATVGAMDSFYTITTLNPGTFYDVWVVYRCADGLWFSAKRTIRTAAACSLTGPMSAPTTDSVAGYCNRVNVSWTAVPGATRYRVCYRRITSPTSLSYINVNASLSATLTLTANQTWQIWIQAFCDVPGPTQTLSSPISVYTTCGSTPRMMAPEQITASHAGLDFHETDIREVAQQVITQSYEGQGELTLNALSANKPIIASNHLLLYPNPAQNELSLEWTSTNQETPISYTLYDMQGSKIEERFLSPEDMPKPLKINTSAYHSGQYVLLLRTQEQSYTRTFVLVK